MNPARWNAKFDHASIAVADKDAVGEFLLEILGGTVIWNDRGTMGGLGFQALQIEIGGPIIEIIQPDGPSSFLHRFFERRGPGLHHLCFKVDHLDDLLRELETTGLRVIDIERRHGQIWGAFIHPASAFGMLVQLRPNEVHPEVARDDHPAKHGNPAPRPPRGSLHHTAVGVHDVAAAVAFYRSFLGGTTTTYRNYGEMFGQRLIIPGNQIGFITPSHDGSFLARFLQERGPGMHHLAFYVPELAAAIAAAERFGVRLINRTPKDGPAHDIFIHPSNPTGALIRLQGWLNQD